jgi:hypothetical protein
LVFYKRESMAMTLALLAPSVLVLSTVWLAPDAIEHSRASGVVGAAKACWTGFAGEFVGPGAAADDAGTEGGNKQYSTSAGDDPFSPHLASTPAKAGEIVGTGESDGLDRCLLAPGGEEVLERPMKAAEASLDDSELSVLRGGASGHDDAEPSALVPPSDRESRLSLGDLWAKATNFFGENFATRPKELWQQAASRIDSMIAAVADRSADDAEPRTVESPAAGPSVADASDHAGSHWQGCDYFPGGELAPAVAGLSEPRAPEPDEPELVASSEFPVEAVSETAHTELTLDDATGAGRAILLGAARLLDHLGHAALDCSCRLQSLVYEGDRTAAR